MYSTRTGVAKLALLTVIGLVTLKIVVAILTGSISITTQAVDSFLDLFAIAITFMAIKMSGYRTP